jgi:hypothetical protein
MSDMQIDTAEDKNLKHVKPDNLYDMLFTNEGQPKENAAKKVVFSGDSLDFLENDGKNIRFVDTSNGKKAVEIDKLKISKQFKLVNPVPKF